MADEKGRDAVSGPPLDAAFVDAAFEAFERAAWLGNLAVSLARASHDCVKLIDLDGRIVALNPIAQIQLQQHGPLVGRFFADLWREPERASAREALARAAAGQPTTFQGRPVWGEASGWRVSVAPVFDDAGALRFLLACSSEVTVASERDDKALTTDLKASAPKPGDAQAPLVHDDRLEIFGRFVGGVVHDFNNVFASVEGASRLLKRRISDPAVLEILGHLDGAAERGAALAGQLLNFSRGESVAVEVFLPGGLLTRDAPLLRHVVSAQASLGVEAEPTCWPILCSPQKFQLVLFNLVAYARDALGAKGRICVALANCAAPRRPEGLDLADYVALTVTREGCGLPEDVDVRFGAPPSVKPSGPVAGLASAFELAKLCGGGVFKDSADDGGMRVCVYLRRWSGEGDTTLRRQAPEDERHAATK